MKTSKPCALPRAALLLISLAPTAEVAAQCSTQWTVSGGIVSGPVFALAVRSDGNLVAGGSFAVAGGVNANGIASQSSIWGWVPLGSGMSGSLGVVYAVVALPNGEIVAGGGFTTAGGIGAANIARWSDSTSSWAPLGSGTSGGFGGLVYALATVANGDLVAGGAFTIAGGATVNGVARWDGTSWSSLGSGVSRSVGTASVEALLIMPDGGLIAGGRFDLAGGVAASNLARWNGTNWSPLGSGMSGSGSNTVVRALAVLADGTLVAGGTFTTAGGISANHVARWDGVSWSALGSGVNFTGTPSVRALTTLPGGDVLVGGRFSSAGGVSASNIARWDGTSWSTFGVGVSTPGVDGVLAFAHLPNTDVAVGGNFTSAGGMTSSSYRYLVRLATTCPASATSQGAGCTGSGGPNVLTAATLPWIGSTFRASATGMPAVAFVATVTGFAPLAISLAALLPQGLPGCTLLVSPDLLDVLLPIGGIAQSQIALPNSVSLVGQTFRQQMVPLELDLSFAITAITSTNALLLTVGAF